MSRLPRVYRLILCLPVVTAMLVGCKSKGEAVITADELRARAAEPTPIVSAAELPIELTYPQSDDQGYYVAPAEHASMVIAGMVSDPEPIDEIIVNGASVVPYRVENYLPYRATKEYPVYRFHAPVVIAPEDEIVVEIVQLNRKKKACKFRPGRDRVVERLAVLVEAQPRDPWRCARLGSAYYAAGAFDDAIRHFDRAMASGDDLPWAAYHLGMTYLALERTEDALDWFRTTSRLYPAFPDVYYSRGLAYYSTGRHGDAILDFVEAVDIAPSWAEPFLALGLTYYAQKELGEAARRFEEAIGLWPVWAPPYYAAGLVYLDLDRPDEAVRYIDRGVVLGPWQPQHHVLLAEKLAAKGNYNAASRQLQIAEKLGEPVPVTIYERIRPHVTVTSKITDWPWGSRVNNGIRVIHGRGLDDVVEAVVARETRGGGQRGAEASGRAMGDRESGGPRTQRGEGKAASKSQGPGEPARAQRKSEGGGKAAGAQGGGEPGIRGSGGKGSVASGPSKSQGSRDFTGQQRRSEGSVGQGGGASKARQSDDKAPATPPGARGQGQAAERPSGGGASSAAGRAKGNAGRSDGGSVRGNQQPNERGAAVSQGRPGESKGKQTEGANPGRGPAAGGNASKGKGR